MWTVHFLLHFIYFLYDVAVWVSSAKGHSVCAVFVRHSNQGLWALVCQMESGQGNPRRALPPRESGCEVFAPWVPTPLDFPVLAAKGALRPSLEAHFPGGIQPFPW
jgi:hypothetical protein